MTDLNHLVWVIFTGKIMHNSIGFFPQAGANGIHWDFPASSMSSLGISQLWLIDRGFPLLPIPWWLEKPGENPHGTSQWDPFGKNPHGCAAPEAQVFGLRSTGLSVMVSPMEDLECHLKTMIFPPFCRWFSHCHVWHVWLIWCYFGWL